jgi:hypothetical protein
VDRPRVVDPRRPGELSVGAEPELTKRVVPARLVLVLVAGCGQEPELAARLGSKPVPEGALEPEVGRGHARAHAGVGVHRATEPLDVRGGVDRIVVLVEHAPARRRVTGERGRQAARDVPQAEGVRPHEPVVGEHLPERRRGVVADRAVELERQLLGNLAALELHRAAGKVARHVGRERLLDVDRGQRRRREDVERNGAQLRFGAGNPGAVEQRVAVAVAQPAHEDVPAVDDRGADDESCHRGRRSAARLRDLLAAHQIARPDRFLALQESSPLGLAIDLGLDDHGLARSFERLELRVHGPVSALLHHHLDTRRGWFASPRIRSS